MQQTHAVGSSLEGLFGYTCLWDASRRSVRLPVMSRRPRDWVPVIVGLVLVGGTLVVIQLVFRLPANKHNNALALVGIALSLVVGCPRWWRSFGGRVA
jgi:hypothetical protein